MSTDPHYNLLTPAAQADPYPIYHQLWRETPIYWSQPFQAWLITRYADVRALLHHPAMVSMA